MKFKLLIIFSILFSTLALSRDKAEIDAFRANRSDFKLYLKSLLVRRLAISIGNGLRGAGFSEEQIAEKLNAREFDTFSRNVMKTPSVENSINRLIDRLMAPGALEAAFAKARQKRELEARNQLLMAVEEMMKNQKRLAEEAEPKKETTFWDRLWERLKRDLAS